MQIDLSDKPIAEAAYKLAKRHHADVVRKYTGEPYINHPIRVVETLLRYGFTEQETLAVGFLHDCLEDPNAKGIHLAPYAITRDTNMFVMQRVKEITKTKRSTRKATNKAYNEQLVGAYYAVKAVKCADIMDNIAGISAHDPAFASRYIEEKAEQLKCMSAGMVKGRCLMILEAARDVVNAERERLALAILDEEKAKERQAIEEDAKLPFLVEEMLGTFSDFAQF